MFSQKSCNLKSTKLFRWSLIALLGWSGVNWITWNAIAPRVVQAYTANRSIILTRQSQESYENLLNRAESVARAAAQRGFDSDILVTEVSVMVVGENSGEFAPILHLHVSRPNWRQQPDPEVWASYFPDAKSLLLFEELEDEDRE